MHVETEETEIIYPKTLTKSSLAKSIYYKAKKMNPRKAFARASKKPIWLPSDHLDSLQQKYPFLPEYGYDPESLEERGETRATELLTLISLGASKIKNTLELGCWDGMVSCILQRLGKVATAIDIRSEGFDKRALRAGVTLLKMDAAHLKFEDESFDFVFSYAAFEHFDYPELVLQEAIRVVRTGGYICLSSGSLYMSPWGLHAYRSITVPYCHLLFPKEILNKFVNLKGLKPINFDQINRWSLENYRRLWNRYSHKLERIQYCENFDVNHVDLITKFPSCFKSKTEYFDDLVVSSIDVLFRKIY